MRAETAEELNKTKQTCIRLFYAPIHKGRNLLLKSIISFQAGSYLP